MNTPNPLSPLEPLASLFSREAVDQPVPAGAAQVVLAAALARVRRVPRVRVRPAALLVVMPDLGAAVAAARPVVAGQVVAGERAVQVRAGQDVVPVRRVAAAVDDLALLGQRVLLAQLVAVAVQVGDARGYDDALGVLPGAGADAVLGIDGLGAAGAQVRAPGPLPAPAACASCWQCLSAPSMPPKSAPLPEPRS